MTAEKALSRPQRVKVGYIPFEVEYLDDEQWRKRGLEEGDGGNLFGYKGSILVRTFDELHENNVREVLLHEVLHACAYISGLSVEGEYHRLDDVEETFVARISPVLLDVLRSNPSLLKYLVG